VGMHGGGDAGQHLVGGQALGIDRDVHCAGIGYGCGGKPEGGQRNGTAALRVGVGGDQADADPNVENAGAVNQDWKTVSRSASEPSAVRSGCIGGSLLPKWILRSRHATLCRTLS
jgi:hypothetical protein